jgi:flagellar biosynthetic protein FlhB
MSGERTEKPTAHKLKEARKQGQIARSRDLAIAAASVASTLAMAYTGSRLIGGLMDALRSSLDSFGNAPLRDVEPTELGALMLRSALQMATLVGPLALVTMVAAVGMHGFQGGWSFAPGALRLNWSRLNPSTGAKRLSFSQSGVETLKTILVCAIVATLTWQALRSALTEAPRFPWMTPADAAAATWSHLEALLLRAGWFLGAIALADYGWQRFRLLQSMKMTRQEVKDEVRQNEGSGEVKGRIRRLQREMSKRRMLRDIARATVVITNPTHFAVALEYQRESMVAPKVLAKGADHLALKIRERAMQHGVPVIENKPLARSLYASAEIGDTIPAPLFAAVAEVLAYLVRIKRLIL